MEGGPLLQDWWTEIAKTEFVAYLNITAVGRGGEGVEAPDQGMLSKKGGRGFPFCVVMDNNGKVLTEIRPQDKEQFLGGLAPAKRLLGARKAYADNKTPVTEANMKLLEASFEPDEKMFPELKKLAMVPGVDAEAKAAFESVIATWPLRVIMMAFEKEAGAARTARDRDAFEAASNKQRAAIVALYKESKLELTDSNAPFFTEYWDSILNYGLAEPDKAAGMKAVTMLLKKYGSNPNAKDYLDKKKAELDEL